jgi:hypothetical protein
MSSELCCSGLRRITAITPTICDLMGIDHPAVCEDEPLPAIMRAAGDVGVTRARACLIHAPDAVGVHLYDEFRDQFRRVGNRTQVREKLCSVVPSKTPVCFSSMFTGAMPPTHGVTKAVRPRPTLACDTLFDATARAGVRTAIIAVEGSSIDRLFRERDVDYYSLPDDSEIIEQSLELIKAKNHDFLLVYTRAYDRTMHRTNTRAPEALDAFRSQIESFETLVDAFDDAYADRDRVVMFTPDHGAHDNPETGRGTHGDDIPDDMHVHHFFGIRKGT